MGELNFKNNIVSYTENGQTEVLLNFNHILANKSRVPMNALTKDDPTIQDFISHLIESHGELTGGMEEAENAQENLLINILLISVLIATSLPVKVVELGCTNGIMSYYLASVLGRFHPDSSLCCVSDVIGNSSENQWLDKITLALQVPKLSMLASDYDNTQLAGNHFDIVLINGTVNIHNPEAVIKEAERLAKMGGLIICYACGSPLLEHCFQMHFQERKEYCLKANIKIITAKCSLEVWERQEKAQWYAEVDACIKEARAMMDSKPEAAKIRQMVAKIQRYTDQAMDMGELDWKIRLIDEKELLLEHMLEC